MFGLFKKQNSKKPSRWRKGAFGSRAVRNARRNKGNVFKGFIQTGGGYKNL